MLRYSLASLLIGVGAIGAGCAALAHPTKIVAMSALTVAMASLVICVAAVMACRGTWRAFAGSIVMAWFIYSWANFGYWAFAYPRGGIGIDYQLATGWTLDHLFVAIHGESLETLYRELDDLRRADQNYQETGEATLSDGRRFLYDATQDTWNHEDGRTLFAKEHFVRIGHLLWAGLFSLCGGALAARLSQRVECRRQQIIA